MSVKRQLLVPRYKAVGDRLRKAREEAGLTQQELAVKVGLVQKQISTLEAGRQLPMAARLPVIAESVGKTIDWLLTGGEGAAKGRFPVEHDEEPVKPSSQRKRKRA